MTEPTINIIKPPVYITPDDYKMFDWVKQAISEAGFTIYVWCDNPGGLYVSWDDKLYEPKLNMMLTEVIQKIGESRLLHRPNNLREVVNILSAYLPGVDVQIADIEMIMNFKLAQLQEVSNV